MERQVEKLGGEAEKSGVEKWESWRGGVRARGADGWKDAGTRGWPRGRKDGGADKEVRWQARPAGRRVMKFCARPLEAMTPRLTSQSVCSCGEGKQLNFKNTGCSYLLAWAAKVKSHLREKREKEGEGTEGEKPKNANWGKKNRAD